MVTLKEIRAALKRSRSAKYRRMYKALRVVPDDLDVFAYPIYDDGPDMSPYQVDIHSSSQNIRNTFFIKVSDNPQEDCWRYYRWTRENGVTKPPDRLHTGPLSTIVVAFQEWLVWENTH